MQVEDQHHETSAADNLEQLQAEQADIQAEMGADSPDQPEAQGGFTGTPSATNVYIHALPPEVTDEHLTQIFGAFGDIESARVIVDLVTHKSKGYGFVKFKSPESATNAIAAMDGHKIKDKPIVVKAAFESTPNSNIYIKGLPVTVTVAHLKTLFGECGEVADCRILTDAETQISRGSALVRFTDVASATKAVQTFDGKPYPLKGFIRPMSVRFADTEEDKALRKAKSRKRLAVHSRFVPYGAPPNPYMMSPPPAYPSPYYGGYEASSPHMAHYSPSMTSYGQAPLQHSGAFAPLSPGSPANSRHMMHSSGGYSSPGMSSSTGYSNNGQPSYSNSSAQYSAQQPQGAAGSLSQSQGVSGPPPGFSPIPNYQSSLSSSAGYLNPLSLSGSGGLRASGSGPDPNVYIYHLPPDSNDVGLYQRFVRYGPIRSVRVVTDPTTGACKGFGFVRFHTMEAAHAAIASENGQWMGGKVLAVSLASKKTSV